MKTTTNQNLDFNIVALSVPVINKNKSGFKTAIVSTISTESFKIHKVNFLKRMNDLGLRSIVLVFVTDDKRFFVNDLKEIFGQEAVLCTLKLMHINYDDFFSLSSIEYFFSEKKDKNFETFYAFKGKSWPNICSLFISAGVDISGGSNNKKHLLSPNQFRLAQFLFCLHGTEASKVISKTFIKPRTAEIKKAGDYSTKFVQDHVIDLAKSNEYLRARILNDESSMPKNMIEYFKHQRLISSKSRLDISQKDS